MGILYEWNRLEIWQEMKSKSQNQLLLELHFHHTQRPFEPFRLLVADGRSYDVKHPERLASLRSGRMISVATNEGFVILDLLLITGLEKLVGRGGNRSRRRAS